jgi:hypothetical protein
VAVVVEPTETVQVVHLQMVLMVDLVVELRYIIAVLQLLAKELLDKDLQEALLTTMELLAIQDRLVVVEVQLQQHK